MEITNKQEKLIECAIDEILKSSEWTLYHFIGEFRQELDNDISNLIAMEFIDDFYDTVGDFISEMCSDFNPDDKCFYVDVYGCHSTSDMHEYYDEWLRAVEDDTWTEIFTRIDKEADEYFVPTLHYNSLAYKLVDIAHSFLND